MAPVALALVGSRSRLTASVTQSGDRWNATIPLLASRWGSAEAAPPSGRYHFTPSLRVEGALPSPSLIPGAFRIAFDAAESATAVVFSAPLTAPTWRDDQPESIDHLDGPVVRDAAELVALVRNLDQSRDEYAQKYAAWRARFNPRDDGHAAERVIARILSEGILQ